MADGKLQAKTADDFCKVNNDISLQVYNAVK